MRDDPERMGPEALRILHAATVIAVRADANTVANAYAVSERPDPEENELVPARELLNAKQALRQVLALLAG